MIEIICPICHGKKGDCCMGKGVITVYEESDMEEHDHVMGWETEKRLIEERCDFIMHKGNWVPMANPDRERKIEDYPVRVYFKLQL